MKPRNLPLPRSRNGGIILFLFLLAMALFTVWAWILGGRNQAGARASRMVRIQEQLDQLLTATDRSFISLMGQIETQEGKPRFLNKEEVTQASLEARAQAGRVISVALKLPEMETIVEGVPIRVVDLYAELAFRNADGEPFDSAEGACAAGAAAFPEEFDEVLALTPKDYRSKRRLPDPGLLASLMPTASVQIEATACSPLNEERSACRRLRTIRWATVHFRPCGGELLTKIAQLRALWGEPLELYPIVFGDNSPQVQESEAWIASNTQIEAERDQRRQDKVAQDQRARKVQW